MKFNPPYKLRAALYIVTAVGMPIMMYLLAKGLIGEQEMTLWSGLVTVVGALAALNVSKPE